MRVDFQKTHVFPIDFNHFIKLGGRFRVTLGRFLAYEGGFGSISRDLGVSLGLPLAYEGDFGGTWSTFWVYEGDFGATLESLWGSFWYAR